MLNPSASALARKSFFILPILAIIVQLGSCVDGTCNVTDKTRIDCGWSGITQVPCEARNCCWKAPNNNGFPWCFYDSTTTPRLRTAKGCEHYPAVYLQCNRNETIRIHDAFYGRNNGDNSCHFTGTVTCVNPNATEIVRRICNDNSTCSISPKGSIWKFDPLCDNLNAQLVVQYMCISKDHPVSVSSSAYTGIIAATPTSTTVKSSIVSISAFDIKSVAPSTVTVTRSMTLATTTLSCACPEVSALTMEVDRKDKIIIGLSAVLTALALVALLWTVLLCRKNHWYIVKEKRDDELRMESVETPMVNENKANNENKAGIENKGSLSNNAYESPNLEHENPYYGSGR